MVACYSANYTVDQAVDPVGSYLESKEDDFMFASRNYNLKLIALLAVVFLVVCVAVISWATRPVAAFTLGSDSTIAPSAISAVGTPICGPSWGVVPSPNVQSGDHILNGVAVVSSTEVWAAGSYTNTSGMAQTLIERWDGTQWNIVPSPNAGAPGNNYLQAISASASNDVWAVGYYNNGAGAQTLILHWNGTQWDIVSSPSPSATENYLFGVTAISANSAWAVGYYNNGTLYRTLTMRWNGTSWNTVSSPNPLISLGSGLRAVTAISANDVWAVGGYVSLSTSLQTLALHWNGSSWSIVSSPNTGSGNTGLVGVSGTASNNVWAVGLYYDGTRYLSLVERWNGSSWSIVSTPGFGTGTNGLSGVVALSQNDVWAVGAYENGTTIQTLALHWNGTQWTQTPSENPGASLNGLFGVGAMGGDLWSVGGYSDGASALTLVERYVDVPCLTPTPTGTPGATITPTETPTTESVLVGHVTWQGRPAQPHPLQQVPITLTLKMGNTEINYPSQSTDANGFFTVSIAGLAGGTYNWRVKNPKYLANAGTVELPGLQAGKLEGWKVTTLPDSNLPTFQPSNVRTAQAEMGLMEVGDANDDNAVNVADFNIMKVTFGLGIGYPNYDARADFTGDDFVNASDFILLKVNFGEGGAPPVNP